jgi:IS30 family transposase
MPKGYRHLTYDKRCQIYALLKSGHAKTEIAYLLGVHRSTITKELKRNTGGKGYRYLQAQAKASARRAAASGAPRKMKPGLVREIEEKLTQDQWSPDQISGWLKRQGRVFISCERIYRHIWKDKRNGGELWRHLRHSGKKYNRRKGKTSGRGLIPGRVDIAERPAIVQEKRRIGDWEGDAIIGRSLKGAILTHVDRTSKYTKLAILPDRSAASVQKACDASLLPIAHKVETITYDNGKEFAGHAQIAARLGAHIYFAKPYHAWERGLNEHTNGLVRQYFPKGSDFSTLTPAEVQRVEDKLNARPRKVLGYKTPSEVFFATA